MSSGPDFAPAFFVFGGMGVVLVVAGFIVLADPRRVGRRWTEWLYVHAPGDLEASDAAFARSRARYRLYGAVIVLIGVLCIYSSVSDIFFPG